MKDVVVDKVGCCMFVVHYIWILVKNQQLRCFWGLQWRNPLNILQKQLVWDGKCASSSRDTDRLLRSKCCLKGLRVFQVSCRFCFFFCLLEQRMLHALHVTRFRLTNFKRVGSPHRGIYLIRGMSTGRSSQFCLGLTVQQTLPTWHGWLVLWILQLSLLIFSPF